MAVAKDAKRGRERTDFIMPEDVGLAIEKGENTTSTTSTLALAAVINEY